MAEVIKAYTQTIGKSRFIGKKYGEKDRVDGLFAARWNDWFSNGWFDVIERQVGGRLKEVYEDGDAYIGFMRETKDGSYEYWIGCLVPADIEVPEGFDHIDLPKGKLGVCWVYGKENEVYGMEGQCIERLKKGGVDLSLDCCFERYVCPRFTAPDEKGNIILDICFFTK